MARQTSQTSFLIVTRVYAHARLQKGLHALLNLKLSPEGDERLCTQLYLIQETKRMELLVMLLLCVSHTATACPTKLRCHTLTLCMHVV
jgi:hypothetical protein